MVFGSTKFGRHTTLQCNYSQLRWETVTFGFIIARDKFNCYYSEAPTLSGKVSVTALPVFLLKLHTRCVEKSARSQVSKQWQNA